MACAATRMRIGSPWLLALVLLVASGAHGDPLAAGDAAWDRRADGEQDGHPLPGPIRAAIRHYEAATSERPRSLEARWKLLRALYFAADFASDDAQEKRAFVDRATAVSQDAIARIDERIGVATDVEDVAPEDFARVLSASDVPAVDVARVYFWSAINWGVWSRDAGLLGAVRQGVANRLHRYASITVALEPSYEEGGAFRLLGQLHAQLPRVPFVSGWVDRSLAIPLLERAYAMAPANPGNRLLLALTLLDLAPERRAEALDLLRQVASLTPRPTMRVEDLAMRAQARKRLVESGAAMR